MKQSCIFCRILAGEIPASFVHQDDQVVAFDDVNPQAPVHVLIIPREHIAQALDLTAQHGLLLGRMFEVAGRLARERDLGNGYRLVINNGAEAGQSVFHLHVHLLGGRGMKWPPG